VYILLIVSQMQLEHVQTQLLHTVDLMFASYSPYLPITKRHKPRPTVAPPPNCSAGVWVKLRTLSSSCSADKLTALIGVATISPYKIVSAGNNSSYHRPPFSTVFESSCNLIRATTSVAVSIKKLNVSS